MDKRSAQSKIITVAISILLAILLAIGIVGFAYAKYIVTDAFSDSAQTARWGTIELKEHTVEFNEEEDKYEFTNTEIPITNVNNNIEPGTTILKDPFIVLKGVFEVSFALYLKVTEVNFPKTIEYDVANNWELISGSSTSSVKTYKYSGNIEINKTIYILKDNELRVGEGFNPDNSDFTLNSSKMLV